MTRAATNQAQADKFRQTFHPQFRHHPRLVYLDGSGADAKGFGDLAIVPPDHDQVHDFLFARRQERRWRG